MSRFEHSDGLQSIGDVASKIVRDLQNQRAQFKNVIFVDFKRGHRVLPLVGGQSQKRLAPEAPRHEQEETA